MTEQMIVEAVRAAVGPDAAQRAAQQAAAPQAVADPAAVERFQAAMGVSGPAAAGAVTPVPFATEVAASWRMAQANNQGLLHRIRALTQLDRKGNVAAAELMELQYDVMNLTFQQEVVTRVADKSSNAIQTLIKNQ